MARNNDRVTLYVGEERFVTTRTTLSNGMLDGSNYFARQFDFEDNSRLIKGNIAELTSRPSQYYMDLNPVIFSYVLDYLRGGVMPLLWTEQEGFDYIAYAKLEKMADFLMVERLRHWVSEKRYLQAVEYVHHASRQTLKSMAYTHKKPDMPASWSMRRGANVTCTVTPELCTSSYRRDGEITVITKELVINNRILFDED